MSKISVPDLLYKAASQTISNLIEKALDKDPEVQKIISEGALKSAAWDAVAKARK